MKPQNINPVKRRRVLMGLTQEDLANKSGLSVATIWNVENAFYGLTIDTAKKIGKVFELQPGTLVNEWVNWKEREEQEDGV